MEVFLILILLVKFGVAFNQQFQFLQDFVSNKNVMLTVYTCDKQGTIKSFLAGSSHLDNLIGLQFYGNTSNRRENMFNNLSPRNWYVIDIQSCGAFSELLFTMNKTNAFRYPSKHLFLIDVNEYPGFLEYICKCRILPASEILIATFNKTNIEIFETYKIRSGSQCITTHYGNWSKGNGINYFYWSLPITERRRNFQKHEFVISVIVNSTSSLFLNFDDLSETILNEPYFLEDFPLVYNMINYINASYTMLTSKVYGQLNHTTGKYYGLIHDLMKETGDISGVGLFANEERLRILHYLVKDCSWGTKLILKKPSTSYIENIYLMTFTGQVWAASLFVLVIFGIALYISLNWKASQEKKVMKHGVSDATLLSFEALCQQGTIVDPETYSGRILLIILFTAFMFLYAAYSGYILVLLRSTRPIQSIRHLVDSRLECGGINISFIMDYYTMNKDPALRDLYQKKLQPNRFMSLEEGLKRVQQGNFAFHSVLSTSYTYIRKTFTNYDICQLQELPAYLNNDKYFVVAKTSQYTEFFKVGLMRITELGFPIRNKYRISRKPKCYNEEANFQSVGMYDCFIVFKLFLLGSCLSFLVLAMEITNYNISQRRKQKIFCKLY